jgi:hypothetical protein
MANNNSPFGLRQVGLNGSPVTNFSLVTRKAGIDKDDATAIYCGDLLKRLNTGYVAQWTNGTAVSQAVGVFFGCEYYSVSQNTKVFNRFWPGSDAAADVDVFYIPFQQTPNPLFVIQSGAAGIAFADIGKNVDIVVGSGNATTGFSGSYLSTVVDTATVPLTIVDLWTSANAGGVGPGVEAGAYNWVLCAANSNQITGL